MRLCADDSSRNKYRGFRLPIFCTVIFCAPQGRTCCGHSAHSLCTTFSICTKKASVLLLTPLCIACSSMCTYHTCTRTHAHAVAYLFLGGTPFISIKMYDQFWLWYGKVLQKLRYQRHIGQLWQSGYGAAPFSVDRRG